MQTGTEPTLSTTEAPFNVTLQALQSTELFERVEQMDLEAIAPRCRVLKYAPGQEVFAEGDIATSLFVLVSGEVAVLKRSAAGKAHEVARLSGRCAFGELVLLGMKERTATMRANTPIRVVEVPAAAFPLMRAGSFAEFSPGWVRAWRCGSGRPRK